MVRIQRVKRSLVFIVLLIVIFFTWDNISPKAQAVDGGIKVVSQPHSISVIRGSTGKITFKVSGFGIRYQWYISGDNGKNWEKSDIDGNNSKTISIRATKSLNGKMFMCRAYNSYDSVYSNAVKLTTLAVISEQPKNKTVNPGAKVVLSIKSRSTVATYQWQVSTNNGKTWKNSGADGSQTNKLSFTASVNQNGYKYRCKLKNGTWTEYSKTVTLGVKPKITSQPKNRTLTADSRVSFSVKANGKNLKYQWQYSINNGTSWKNSKATGYNTSLLKFTAKEKQHNYLFRCVITSGNVKTYSKAAVLHVRKKLTKNQVKSAIIKHFKDTNSESFINSTIEETDDGRYKVLVYSSSKVLEYLVNPVSGYYCINGKYYSGDYIWDYVDSDAYNNRFMDIPVIDNLPDKYVLQYMGGSIPDTICCLWRPYNDNRIVVSYYDHIADSADDIKLDYTGYISEYDNETNKYIVVDFNGDFLFEFRIEECMDCPPWRGLSYYILADGGIFSYIYPNCARFGAHIG